VVRSVLLNLDSIRERQELDEKIKRNSTTQRKGHMSPNKLTPDERRAIVLAALQTNSNKSEIARCYNIRRQRVYQLLEDVLLDPKGKLMEAEREAQFRRRVWELCR
jgi:transposase-like protein